MRRWAILATVAVACGGGPGNLDGDAAIHDGGTRPVDAAASLDAAPSDATPSDATPSFDAAFDASVADAGPELPAARPVVALSAGGGATCARFGDGGIRCWGNGSYGMLGYGNTEAVGVTNTPVEVGDIDVGAPVAQVDTSLSEYTCAVLDGGGVRCWGRGSFEFFCNGVREDFGDDEPAAASPLVQLGGTAVQVDAGGSFTCALLVGGSVRCWGVGGVGELGYPGFTIIGDQQGETPASMGDIDLGGSAIQIAAGSDHACALLEGGAVRCWGRNTFGALGYPGLGTVGVTDTPASAGDVDVGGPVTAIAAGGDITCAILEGGDLRCWGYGADGALGRESNAAIGDDETPASIEPVDVGGPVVSVAVGSQHVCAVLASGDVRCWGFSTRGALGQPGVQHIGLFETPAEVAPVNVGASAVQVVTGARHTCVRTVGGNVRCWGAGGFLGYGHDIQIGDDEPPASAGIVPHE